ncbi:MAG TPA: NAD(P)/FAD-dependent oxidoreductase [Taishania sp.]|nr:NAD(P)/FAD-dependent oxidoreductase [Taishania sp.]
MANHYDVVVIGAGPSGAVAAAKLLQAGKSVLVLEKLVFPRFVIGESLLPHCMDYLEALDLIPVIEKHQFQIKNGVCFHLGEETCPFLFDKQFNQDAWTYTWQVKRADFDKILIDEVERRGAKVIYEATVTGVDNAATIQHVHFEHPELGATTVTCNFVMDASGYGRVLPRLKNLDAPISTPPRGAIFTHIKDTNRTDNAGRNIYVHIFRNNTAWMWSIPFSDGTCSVGIVSDVEFIRECEANDNEKFKEFLNEFPGLDGRFVGVEYQFEPKVILNYAAAVSSLYGEGFVMCGNATEFLDPTFSSGVMFAMSSGFKSASLVIDHLNGQEVDWEKDYSDHMKKGINVFRSYVNAWYNGDLPTIFFSKERNEEFMKQICSVLAGYVWDDSNPFVRKHNTILNTLAHVIRMNEE